MRILVFTEGTILDDRSNVESWILCGDAAAKLNSWRKHGSEIIYLSSKRKSESLEEVKRALCEGGAPAGLILFRENAEEDYGDVAARASPNVIVEDDCVSIGGEVQMTYPKLRAELKSKVKSIVVPEFGGIDHLPDDPSELLKIK